MTVQAGEEKAAGRPDCGLPVPEGAHRKDGGKSFYQGLLDSTKSNGFTLREGRFRLHIRKNFFLQ